MIRSADGAFKVEDTVKMLGGKVGHIGRMVSGMFKTGDTVTLEVDAERRNATCKNHSATHLLHAATPLSDMILKDEITPVFPT